MTTNGTMVGVPTPGGSNMYKPAPASGTQMHGDFPQGGSQKVMPVSGSGTKFDWAETGGSQQVKPA